MWERRDDGLWLRECYWPPKCEVDKGQPGRPPALTPAQQERAIMLIRQGMPLQKIADLFGISYEVVRRLAKKHGVELRRSERKLALEQLEQAYSLLRAGVSLRQVAEEFEVHPETLRRQAQQDGVELQPRGERLTPTQLKLTPAQRQEARELVKLGVSLRQTAKRFGISRCALEGILNDGETSVRDPRPSGPKLTPEQQQEACDLVRAGVSLRQSAKQFGINHHTLIRYLRKREESGSEEEDK